MSGGNARYLRNNPTPEEAMLWKALRMRQLRYKFRRQQDIDGYIADFACLERRLLIEVDGSQHLNNPYDEVRDDYIKSQGFRMLRFWNSEIHRNLEGVVDTIVNALEEEPPPRPKKH